MSFVPRRADLENQFKAEPSPDPVQSWSCRECERPWFQGIGMWPPRVCPFCGSARTIRA